MREYLKNFKKFTSQVGIKILFFVKQPENSFSDTSMCLISECKYLVNESYSAFAQITEYNPITFCESHIMTKFGRCIS